MNQRTRLLYVAFALVLGAGVAFTWLLIDLDVFSTPPQEEIATAASKDATVGPLDVHSDSSWTESTAALDRDPTDESLQLEQETGTETGQLGTAEREGSQPRQGQPGASPDPGMPAGAQPTGGERGTSADPESGSPPPPDVVPRSARDPTPREAAARKRYGTNAGLPTKVNAPEVAKTEPEELPLDLTKLAEPEVWAEYWAREGYTPPAMVKTPARGKLMSLLTNTQVPGATVRVFTFFPATSHLGGAILPVVMETTTDEKGFFEANLPTPTRWLSNYPRYALSVEWQGKRLVDAGVYENLRAGEDNEIGVFWAPEEPYEVDVSVSSTEPGLTVAPTGRLDPRRWETRRARSVFAAFGTQPIGSGIVKLIGTWDFLKTGDLPYITLLRNGEPLLTRQCKLALVVPPSSNLGVGTPVPIEPQVGRPFHAIQFPNDGYLSLSGTVVDKEGVPIEGALLSATVDGEPRLAYSDPTGFFEFHVLPDAPLSVSATHDLYIARDVELQPGTLDARIELPFRRPRISLNIVSDATDQPVSEIWLNGIEVTSPYAAAPKGGPLTPRHMASATGEYLFEHDKRVTFLTIQAPGFRPKTLEWVEETGNYDVRLLAGLTLDRRPRDYDAAQTPSLFRTDEGDGPGLWSLDDDHWVEYSFNFGDEAGDFDLLLGVTNHSYGTLPLDNEYLFEVDVFVDGAKIGRLNIASDPSVAQIGRLSLGNLSGQHTVRLMWMNDRYIPGQLDANIRYESLRIMQTD